MNKTTFIPTAKVTIAQDSNFWFILFDKGLPTWQYSNIIYQISKKESTNYPTAQRELDITLIANELTENKWILSLIDKMLDAGLKFYIELNDHATEWIKIGFRIGSGMQTNKINWFKCITFGDKKANLLAFDHTYNQADGATIKAFKHGEKVREQLEKKIGTTIREIINTAQ